MQHTSHHIKKAPALQTFVLLDFVTCMVFWLWKTKNPPKNGEF